MFLPVPQVSLSLHMLPHLVCVVYMQSLDMCVSQQPLINGDSVQASVTGTMPGFVDTLDAGQTHKFEPLRSVSGQTFK